MAAEATKWWHNILQGLAIICLGGFVFWYFWDFENSGQESLRIWFVFAALYNAGGKWLTSSVFVVAGMAVCVYGLIKAIRGPSAHTAGGEATVSRHERAHPPEDQQAAPRPIDEYIEGAIDDLVAVLGIKEPVAIERFVKGVRPGQIEKCIEDIGGQLGLPVKANLVVVSDEYCRDESAQFETTSLAGTDHRGRATEGITAQVSVPGHLPSYGSPRLVGFPITVKVSASCYKYAETFVAVMAHELSHVLLRSLAHPKSGDEIYADLTAMLLGFAGVIEAGRIVKRVTVEGNVRILHTTTYGYLDNAGFAFAYRRLNTITHNFKKLRHKVLSLASELKSQTQDVEETLGLFNEFLYFLDTHLDQEVDRQDSAGIVAFHRPDYTQPVEAMARASACLAAEATEKAQQTGYFTREAEAILKSYAEQLHGRRAALAKEYASLQSDCQVLRRNVAVLDRQKLEAQVKVRKRGRLTR